MWWFASGNTTVLVLHIFAFFICRAVGVEGWWLATAPLSVTVFLIGVTILIGLAADYGAFAVCMGGGVVAVVIPGSLLEACVKGLADPPPDLVSRVNILEVAAVSSLPIIAFYAFLFVPYPEGTVAIQAVLWAFVVMGLQMAPLGGHFAREEPRLIA